MNRVGAFAILLLLCLLLTACSHEVPPELTLRMLDVGQGDAILLTTKEGEHILIDAGPASHRELLCLRLEQLGIRTISLMILTHPDEDHMGGASSVLERFDVKEVWTNGQPSEERFYPAVMEIIANRRITHKSVQAGESRRVGDLQLQVLSPFSVLPEDSNAASIVLRLECGGVSALFMGDADLAIEEQLMREYGSAWLNVDLLKIGHHGSETATGEVFLNTVSPKYALISAGYGNPHGHPHGGVLQRLENMNAEILRTDQKGELTLCCSAGQITVQE